MSDVDERPGRGARDYLLFNRWTLIDPQKMGQRRAQWPKWRQMLRPVGATLWWAGVVIGMVLPGFDDRPAAGPAAVVLEFAMAAGVLTCATVGIGLEWRDRRREGRPMLG